MPTKEAKKKYDIQYAKDNLKRIPLNVRKEKYEEIKTAAAAAGEPVNGYIKRAIDERMERDTLKQELPTQTQEPAAQQQKTAEQQPDAPAAHTSPIHPSTLYLDKKALEDATSKVDLKRLPNDILYQMDIAEALGTDALAALLEKARQQLTESKG